VSNEELPGKRAVWARGCVFTTQCPKSLITAQSLGFLDEYNAWKQFGWLDASQISAKSADALIVLESAEQKETQSGEAKK
jgi:hypothetical protein